MPTKKGKVVVRYRPRICVSVDIELEDYVKANVSLGRAKNLSEEIENCIISRMYLMGDLEDEGEGGDAEAEG